MQLLKLRSKGFSKLKQWLEKKTEKYTSHDIQNEILMLMAHQILRNLAEEIRGSFNALIRDEKLTLCLRWIDDCFSVYKDFLGFYEVLNIKSGTIVPAIRDVLSRTVM